MKFKIKLCVLTYCFVTTAFVSTAQSTKYFQGTIGYKHSFKSPNGSSIDEVLTTYFGNATKLSFKEGNYRHDFDGGMMEFDIYNKADNKIYFKKRGSDTIFWTDCSERGRQIKNMSFSSHKESILGILCDQLVIEYDENIQTHYYNADSILIDPGWFKNFKQDGEYLIDEKEKSIFIKSENQYPNFTMIMTATEIRRRKLDNTLFIIPKNSILTKAPQ